MHDDEAHLERIGEIVWRRRVEELGLLQSEVTARGGPSTKKQTQIENGQPIAHNLTTLYKMDIGLGWERGTMHALLYKKITEPGQPLTEPDPAPAEIDDLRGALEAAFERHGIDRIAARHASPEGLQLGPNEAAQLIRILNTLPDQPHSTAGDLPPDTENHLKPTVDAAVPVPQFLAPSYTRSTG